MCALAHARAHAHAHAHTPERRGGGCRETKEEAARALHVLVSSHGRELCMTVAQAPGALTALKVRTGLHRVPAPVVLGTCISHPHVGATGGVRCPALAPLWSNFWFPRVCPIIPANSHAGIL